MKRTLSSIAIAMVFAIAIPARAAKNAPRLCIGNDTFASSEANCRDASEIERSPIDRLALQVGDDRVLLWVAQGGESTPGKAPSDLVMVPHPSITSTSGRNLDQVTIAATTSDGLRSWNYSLDGVERRKTKYLGLPKGTYTLRVGALGHTEKQLNVTVDATRTDVPSIALTAHPRLTGSIVDANTGTGLTGAAILDENDKAIGFVNDVAGRFTITVPPDDWPKTLSIVYPGRGRTVRSIPPRIADTDLGPIMLRQSGSVAVEWPDGTAVEKITLLVQLDDGHKLRANSWEIGEGHGEPRLLLEDVSEGTYDLLAAGATSLERFATQINVHSDKETKARLDIDTRDLAILARTEERALAGAHLTLQPTDNAWSERLTLDEDGRYHGAFWQTAPLLGFLEVPGKTTPFFTTKNLPEEGDVDWEIVVSGQTLTGVVLGTEGEQITNARILLRSMYPDGASTKIVRTGERGEFTVDYLRQGQHTINAAAAGYLESSITVDTSQRVGDTNVEVRLEKGMTRVLRIVNANGTPAAGAIVVSTTAPAEADATGRVQVTTSSANPAPIFVVPKEGSFAIVHLDKGQPEEVTVGVPPPDATIVVRAESDDGIPLEAGLMVRYKGMMLPIEVLRTMHRIQGVLFQTSTDGIANLRGLPLGLYEFWPIFDYSEIDRTALTPGVPAASLAVGPGDNWVIMTFSGQ